MLGGAYANWNNIEKKEFFISDRGGLILNIGICATYRIFDEKVWRKSAAIYSVLRVDKNEVGRNVVPYLSEGNIPLSELVIQPSLYGNITT